MDLNSLIVRSFKNILFAIAVLAMTLPILLSMPGFSGYIVNALSVLGIGE
ncbi:MAG TPA: hypothetical protein PK605_03705 [Ignavibacteria bacterium]|nr:hypothetical protein [Ignavibacteria bacterium]HRE10899.1 hypothetical protein [Ignavibacteria bacterium]HRF66134.1 hypothetical protein [Ignavibacteria bacterium]HRJ03490.1 hypothetical protein [Ignavibacteria bacterium]HRJ84074.1 hypothetical protein [Ignavibacteria bacterium]